MSRTAVTPEQFTRFGELLRFLRHRAGMNQRELAIAVNYSEAQISRLEHNQRAPDAAILTARFVPALELEREPQWVARLLELAARTRDDKEAGERKVAAARHNLPTQLTSFIGRDESLEEIAALLGNPNCRLLSLVGPGGIGKTRLALEAAAQQHGAFRDGVFFVSLVGIQAGQIDSIVPAIAAAIGYKFVGTNEPRVQLGNYLRAKEMLLVVDNFEHLLKGREIVNELLKTAPAIKLLVTTRQPLNLQAEWVMRIGGLDYPATETGQDMAQYSAAELFLERAKRADGRFKLDRETERSVCRICQRVEGMPLALELAAARIRTLPVNEIAAQVEQSFASLETMMFDVETRHSSLRGVLDWSYGLLEPAEQTLFRRLAVFQGSWMQDAAEAVGAGGEVTVGMVPDLTKRLIDKSLVLFEDKAQGTWYRMLEPVRQYGLMLLRQSGEPDQVYLRHARFYGGLADAGRTEKAYGELPEGWDARMRMEQDNVRLALTWCKSAQGAGELGLRLLEGLYLDHAGWNQALGLMEDVLTHAEVGASDESWARAHTRQGIGFVLSLQGNYREAVPHLLTSLESFRLLGDDSYSISTLERLGWIAREQGDIPTALSRLEEALVLARREGGEALIGNVTNSLAETLLMAGDIERAKNLLNQNLTLARQRGDSHVEGWSLNHLGHAAQIKGDYILAAELHTASLSVFDRENPVWVGTAEGQFALGETALARGDAKRAAGHLGKSLRMSRDLGYRNGIAWSLASLAGVAFLNEEPERAAFLWGVAETMRKMLGVREGPATRATHEQLKRQAREELGEDAFEAAWARGARTPVEEVIADAINESVV